MNERDLFRGIGEVNDDAVQKARPCKRRKNLWLPVLAAACLMLAIGIGAVSLLPRAGSEAPADGESTLSQEEPQSQAPAAQSQTQPNTGSPQAVALNNVQYPEYPKAVDMDLILEDNDAYREATANYYDQADAICGEAPDASYLSGLHQFSMESTRQILSGTGTENRIYSPANLYMALSMLAEVCDGTTREQVLSLLGAGSVETVRAQTERIWRNLYRDDGVFMTRLANSFWLQDGLTYHQETLDVLQDYYFASAFSGHMGTTDYDAAIAAWINEQTGNLLQDEAAGIHTTEQTVLMLLSTLYFYEPWAEHFYESSNTEDIFTMSDGTELTCTYLNGTRDAEYIRGDNYKAATLEFAPNFTISTDHQMLLILPDEGVSVDDLLADSTVTEVLQTVALGQNSASVEFTIPKFAVSCDLELSGTLQALGVTDAFTDAADFSPLMDTSVTPITLTSARQAAIVRIDENGCEAASYVNLMMEAGEAEPEEEPPTLILDRPFLFVITGLDGLPLYVGVVNNPLQAA